MKRLVKLALLASFLFATPVNAGEPTKPNIIFIFTDDQGYGDVGCFGGTGFKTPNLDQMAKEGMKFTSFYVGCPVCSGSRTALMTGRHFQRTGMVPVMFPGNKVGLNPNEITIATLLRRLGYRTMIIGKWHLGHLARYLPTSHGFDSYFGIPYSNDMTIDPVNAKFNDKIMFREGLTAEKSREGTLKNKVPLMRGEEVVEYPVDQTTLTKRYTEEAVKLIGENKDRPFFLYVPHAMPHGPLAVSPAFKGRTPTLYGDTIEEIDWSVGEILKAVKANGLDEKTLVIFSSDNGPAGGPKSPGSAGPFRGRKATLYEGGVREPCIMRWPGKIPADTECSETAATIDMLPTFAKLAGSQAPTDRPIDGKDIRPLMFGEKGAKTPHESYVLLHGLGAVRSGAWKFYPWQEGADVKKKDAPAKVPENAPKTQLYDLSKDIGEKTNVADRHPDVVARLTKVFQEFSADVKKNKLPVSE